VAQCPLFVNVSGWWGALPSRYITDVSASCLHSNGEEADLGRSYD